MASDEVRTGASPCPTTFEEELQKMEREGREVAELEDKEREVESLKRRAQALEGEIGVARVVQRRRAAEAALPVFQPHEPCSAPWAEMRGDARVRACSRCKQRVYDLAGLAPDEAKKLLGSREGRLPTHLIGRADGTVTASACELGKRKLGPLAIRLAAASAAGLFGAGLATGFVWPREAPAPQVIHLTMPAPPEVVAAPAAEATPPPPPKPAEAAPTPPPPPARDDEADRPRRERHHHHHRDRCGRSGVGLFEGPSLFWLFIGDESASCAEPGGYDEDLEGFDDLDGDHS
jgi:hypothetical protein